MKINSEIIEAYLNDKDMKTCELYPLLKGFRKPSVKRKDVCKELLSQLESILEEFPTFNKDLWNQLFHDKGLLLDRITIVPTVGVKEHTIKKDDNHIYILMDLIMVADVTPMVAQMQYVIENFLSLEITRLCIHDSYPMKSNNYQYMLDYFTFSNGLSNFISWNAQAKNYKFHTQKYEPYKEKVFALLLQSMSIDNKALQHKVLMSAVSGDFWTQFPGAAGMFYFNDVFREYGNDGIFALYKKGPDHFVRHIFCES